VNPSGWRPGAKVISAMFGAALVGAQFVAGQAARNALFLDHFEPRSLPPLIIATSMFSILLVVIGSRELRRVAPSTYVPVAFAASAVLILAEWALTFALPALAARIVYLQISGLGPMLGSGFWLIASERFDPRTAKKHYGEIAGAGTLGGLAGGLIAARVAAAADVGAMLPLVAALQAACAWQLHAASRATDGVPQPHDAWHAAGKDPSGLHVLTESAYLQRLAALVLLGTLSAIFIDYVFMVQVKATFKEGPGLGSFFSLYYATISLVAFIVQMLGSRLVLERLGLGAAASAPALAVTVGGAVSYFVPGLSSIAMARGSEAICRKALLRTGYELFYTPLAPGDKRAIKAVIDVGADRAGDIIGAIVILTLLWLPGERQGPAFLGLAVACSLVALAVGSRLTRGYVTALERSLLDRCVEADLSDIEDVTTRTVVLRTLRLAKPGTVTIPPVDPGVRDIVALHSRDADAIRAVLRNEQGLPASLVPHAIPLLEWDPVANDVIRALRKVAEEHVGAFVDALVDPNQPFAVRRRLARVFSVCVSQRAVDGLMLGLDDMRFEVRFHCARSLSAIVEKNPRVRIDRDTVLRVARREMAASRSVWEGRQLLDDMANAAEEASRLEALVSARASRSLAHVFTLLALVLPPEPLRVAFAGLHATDQALRGTALEYLDAVLPPDIRAHLWPFLEDERRTRRPARPRDEIVADLLRSNESIAMNLDALGLPNAGRERTK
jgi:ATP:ADP antiporter, AAA family